MKSPAGERQGGLRSTAARATAAVVFIVLIVLAGFGVVQINELQSDSAHWRFYGLHRPSHSEEHYCFDMYPVGTHRGTYCYAKADGLDVLPFLAKGQPVLVLKNRRTGRISRVEALRCESIKICHPKADGRS